MDSKKDKLKNTIANSEQKQMGFLAENRISLAKKAKSPVHYKNVLVSEAQFQKCIRKIFFLNFE